MDIDNMLKREPIKRITRWVPSESLIVILPRTLHLRTYRFSLRPVYTVCFTEVDGPSKRGGEEGATSQHNKPHQRNWLWSWICWTFNQSSTMRFQTLWKGPPHPPSSLLLCAWSPIQRKMVGRTLAVGIYLLALNTWANWISLWSPNFSRSLVPIKEHRITIPSELLLWPVEEHLHLDPICPRVK